MKKIILLIGFLIIFTSCSKNIYGKYNTSYSRDKSAFFQITLNSDNTVEKTEIHTISIFAKGHYILKEKQVICFLDATKNNFPPDTLTFKIKGNKLYFVKKGIVNTKFYLKKE
ncbi:hypothetical protein GJU43_07150 [Flavobacterium sp. LC2016-23]|uniref:hypothetical protein n=1 Tax=Flavobacterium sp. LC2016-23 TaxID=2666330 RepID=UPI0012B07A36|nr:hypothetical protein [Flavobacterium sp. LC2016-23]MRX39047.1 hypothetical protein [Flavobacterium sp. LC2016-23]